MACVWWSLLLLCGVCAVPSRPLQTEDPRALTAAPRSPSAQTLPSSGPEPRCRRRRQVFGPDERFSIIGQEFLSRFPFSAAVRVSTGCSGTLVGPRHVLTAAHCVHDGHSAVTGARRLRVGLLRSDKSGRAAFRWIRVKRTHLPKGWVTGSANSIGVEQDYALLELRRAPGRRHMRLGISPAAERLPRLQFSGFDEDRPGQLLYRFCAPAGGTHDLLLQRCDARPGSSGSGVYARMWDPRHRRWQRRLIGVFSGHQRLLIHGAPQDLNVAVRITPLKYAQICYWIHGDYTHCRG